MVILWNVFSYSMGKSLKSACWGELRYFMFSNDHYIKLTFNCFYFILYYSWFIELQFNRYMLLLFIWFIICQVFLFGVLVILFELLIVDLFVHIYRISVCWYWNLSLGVLENCLWAVSKPDIWIGLPRRFVEGCDEGDVWVFIIFRFNWLLCLI